VAAEREKGQLRLAVSQSVRGKNEHLGRRNGLEQNRHASVAAWLGEPCGMEHDPAT